MPATLSPDCVRFVFALCEHPTAEAAPETLLAASDLEWEQDVEGLANEVRRLFDEHLLEADGSGRLRPTLDGLWIALHRARELALGVPPGLLMDLGVLAAPARAC